MVDFSHIFLTSLGCGGIAGLALALLHVLFWRQPWQLSRPAGYAVGMATVGAGIFAAGRLLGTDVPFVVSLGVALPSGLAVVTCYYLRGVFRAIEADRNKRSAFVELVIEEISDGETVRPNTGSH